MIFSIFYKKAQKNKCFFGLFLLYIVNLLFFLTSITLWKSTNKVLVQ